MWIANMKRSTESKYRNVQQCYIHIEIHESVLYYIHPENCKGFDSLQSDDRPTDCWTLVGNFCIDVSFDYPTHQTAFVLWMKVAASQGQYSTADNNAEILSNSSANPPNN